MAYSFIHTIVITRYSICLQYVFLISFLLYFAALFYAIN